ncbi:hypothetical protein Drose_25230 [Dactylosporangium roseum]|uniref:Asp/Glu racemase n=1 Tax=Dactylosporangium roseum TaxID=47989 RepID=A0ABY5YYB0_9ACTN|nr:hypothetical protein [Dactylosporangium roseum]UWZ34517.1 hypothetical protein Drose_25230 [Dactylosporangium roseum]
MTVRGRATTLSIGLLVPPANPAAPGEYRRLLSGLDLRIAALPVIEGSLQERLTGYADRLAEPSAALRSQRPAAVVLACTGCSYGLGVDGDRRLARAVREATDSPAVTAAGAVTRVLGKLNTRSLTLVSPYPRWLTDQAAAFWSAAGIAVTNVVPISGSGKIYDLTPDEVLAVVDSVLADDELAVASGHAVVVTGTGAPSLEALDRRASGSPVPIVSSNLAGAWSVLDELGALDLAEGSGSTALRHLNRIIRSAASPAHRASSGGADQ